FPGFPVLGVLDSENLQISILDLPLEIPRTGTLGLAQSSRFIYVGLQYAFDGRTSYRLPPEIGLEFNAQGILASLNPCSLLVFDKKNFELLHQHYFKIVEDVHSFLLSADEQTLYVVSTGTDEVIRLELKDEYVINESVFWRPDPDGERLDHHHLNSICQWNGDIIISGFGRKLVPDDWNTALNGFVYNITQHRSIYEGLIQPHSLIVIDQRLAVCESRQKKVMFIDHGPQIDLGGYSRGICHLNKKLIVGISARRVKSKSTGKLNKNKEVDQTGCTVCKLSLDPFIVEKVISLNHCANEIYEMLAVDHIEEWPLIPARDYRMYFQDAWEHQRQLAFQETMKCMDKETTALIFVDENLLGLDQSSIHPVTTYSFIEREGIYLGAPEKDDVAIEELNRIHAIHVHHSIAFAWPSFWWLDEYKKLSNFLNTTYSVVFKNDRIIMFQR
ncbi:MAG: DUF4915 domain-containing protein, partial [Saprospiraceae bacterium]